MPKKNPADFIVIFSVILLTSIGIVMVFSASQYSAGIRFNDDFHFLKSQLQWSVIGMVIMAIASKIHYKKIQRYANLILIVCVILLSVIFIPGIGVEYNGATRWIGIGSHTIQPSEIAKIGIIIFMANSLAQKKEDIRTLTRGIIPYILLTGIISGLIVL